jgi:diguanylate cyclase (GGDEF)-like protein
MQAPSPKMSHQSVNAYFVAVTSVAGVVLVMALLNILGNLDIRFFILVFLAAVADGVRIPLHRGYGTLSYGFFLAAFLLYGYSGAVVTAGFAGVSPVFYRPVSVSKMSSLFNSAQYILSVALSSGVYSLEGGLDETNLLAPMNILKTVPVAMAFLLVNHLLTSLSYAVQETVPIREYADLFWNDGLHLLVSTPFTVFVLIFRDRPWLMLLLIVPLFLVGRALIIMRMMVALNKAYQSIYEINREIHGSTIHQQVIRSFEELLHGSEVQLWLNQDAGLYRTPESAAHPENYLLEANLVTQAIQGRKTIMIPKTSRDGRFKDAAARYQSVLVVPLESQGRVLGAVACFRPRSHAFSGVDIRVAETMCRQVSVLLENARLYSELANKAARDPATGLYNHRFFYMELSRRFAKAKETGRPLTVAVIDIDYFKKYNDTYGHLIGDEVLRQVGWLIQQKIGDQGIVARYGGEEFSILLDLPMRQAAVWMEELREEVAAHRFACQGYIIEGLTISAGLASYPDHDRDEKELLEKADQAMYWGAKQRGRNKSAVYSPEYDAHLFVDELTGLYTYHYLNLQLQERFQNGGLVSLIFFDIVDLESINKRFGFEVGNHVLREISLTIKQNVRQGEVAVRYGGDEFLIVVAGVERYEADKIRQRLANAIEQHSYEVAENVFQRIAIRDAVIVYPVDIQDRSVLLASIPAMFQRLGGIGKDGQRDAHNV